MAFSGGSGFGSSFGGGGGGFGQSQSLFGQQQQSNPFGGSSQFGQSSASPFGGQSSGFGFGASQSGFGVSSQAFGFGSSASFQMAFGAQPSSSGFAFGQSTGGSAFGVSQPFGGGSQPSSQFGGSSLFSRPQSSSAFGGGGFSAFGGQSSSAFGFQPSTGFNAQQGSGTAAKDWQKTPDSEGGTSGATVSYMTITAMPQYQMKSVEELRLEDYRAGRKQQQQQPGMQQPQQNTSFMSNQSSSPFQSTIQQSSSPFSFSSSSFQPSSSAFGFSGGFSQPSFGGSSAFNFNTQQSSAPFQAASSAFNFSPSSSPAFGNAFQSSAPFGQSSQSQFNFQQSSQPFQPFQASSQSFFNPQPQQSQSQFNFSFSSAPFSAFQTPTAPFGQQSAPSFSFQPVQQQPQFQQQQCQQPPVQMPQINVNPYGSYPLPVIPPPKVGITASKPNSSKMPILRAQIPCRRGPSSLRFRSRIKQSQLIDEQVRRLTNPQKHLIDASTQSSKPLQLTIRSSSQQLVIRDDLSSKDDDRLDLYRVIEDDQENQEEEDEGTVQPSNSKDLSVRRLRYDSDTSPPKQQQQQPVSLEDSDGIDVDSLLPKVTTEGYYIRPSVAELAFMARYGGEQELANVSNFTVGCEGLGSVLFLEPVDVRGMDVCALVRIVEGGLEVFYDTESPTPEVGTSLNKAAEVTLLKIYYQDPQTKQPSTDQVGIEKFRKRLEKVCKKQNSEMVSYNPELQQWKFRVQHFSRYGITWEMPEEESEDDDAGDADFMDQEPSNLALNFTETENEQRVQSPSSTQRPSSSLTPERFIEIRRALLTPLDSNQRLITRDDVMDQEDIHEKEDVNERSVSLFPNRHEQQEQQQQFQLQSPQSPSEYDPTEVFGYKQYWRTTRPAIVYKDAAGASASLDEDICDVLVEYQKDSSLLDVQNTQQLSACIQDFGATMRPSFRPCWGMHGILVTPGVKDGRHVINISQLCAGAVFAQESGATIHDRYYGSYFPRQVFRIQGLLSVHKQFSQKIDTSREDECSCWKFRCDEGNVQEISDSMCEVESRIMEEGMDISHLETKQLMHERETWSLISLLFRKIAWQQSDDYYDDQQIEAYQQQQRNQLFTEWLKSSCKPNVESVVGLCGSVPSMIIHLLSGLQISVAASVARESKYAALPTFITQISRGQQKEQYQQALECQLKIWEDNGLTPKFVNADMVTLLQVLAGNVHFAQYRFISSLHWRCSLGLFYWYTDISNIPDAVSIYLSEIANGTAVQPNPFYATQMQARNQGLVDAQCLILSLFAKIQLHNPLPTICEVAGYTPDKLDYLTAWFIAQFLTTLNLVPPSQTDDDVMFRVCNSLIAYIDIVGNNFKWCIYIALHLPGDDQFIRLRQKLVQQLLQQHVEEWINDSSALQELGVPRSWLEEAKGYFYQYNHEEEKQLSALLGCGKMREAHDLLFNKIGPQLFLRKQFLQLSQLCSVFQNESVSRGVELFQKYIYLQQQFQAGNSEQVDLRATQELQQNLQQLQGEVGQIRDSSAGLCLVIQKMRRDVQIWCSRLWYVDESEREQHNRLQLSRNIISGGFNEESVVFDVNFFANENV